METPVNTMFFFGNGSAKFFINIPDKALNKFHDRNGFFHILVIFMTVIMESIIKMGSIPPEIVITVAAFRDKAVDMGIPFQIPAKGVKNHNKSRSKILGFIEFVKHTADHTGNRVEKAVKKIGIVQKKMSEIFINSKNAVPVLDRNELKGHTGSTFHRVFVPAGRTETAVTAERDKFHVPTVRTTVHGTTKSGIAAMDHFIYVFYNRMTWM